MTHHVHRCAVADRDHDGPCRCACGAIVERVANLPYSWQWRLADGSSAPFPGQSWQPKDDSTGLYLGDA